MTVNKIQSYAAFIIAITYAFVLTVLPVDAFTDRDNYLIYASSALDILQRTKSDGLLTIFYNEPVWLFINLVMSLLLSPENTVRAIIFASSLTFSYFLFDYLKKKKISHWLLIGVAIMLLPQVMKNYVIHLRQGVAMAIFFLAISRDKSKLNASFLLITPLIHSSFFFVVPVFLIAKKQILIWINPVFVIGIVQLLFLIMLFSLEPLSQLFSARQVSQYIGSSAEVSGFAFLYWSLTLVLFFLAGKRFLRNNLLAVTGILLYLNLYFIFEPSGRIFESYLPMVITAGFAIQNLYGRFYKASYLFIFACQWILPIAVGSEIFRRA